MKNILYIGDPNSIHDIKWISYFSDKPNHYKTYFIYEKDTLLVSKKSESEIANLGIGRKFQKPTVFEDQSVMENLIMALKNKRNPWSVLFYKYNKIKLFLNYIFQNILKIL